jgi:hypothetical protein
MNGSHSVFQNHVYLLLITTSISDFYSCHISDMHVCSSHCLWLKYKCEVV